MKKRLFRLMMAAVVLGIGADVALAGLLPSPFRFSFFLPGLNELFLLPFRLAGCG